MIFQDELVNATLAKTGQLVVLPADVLLNDLVITRILTSVVNEFTRYRPNTKTLDVDIGTFGITLTPDAIYLANLRRRGLTITDIGAGIFYRRTPADYFATEQDPVTNQLVVKAIPGLYRVESGGRYSYPIFIVPSETVFTPIGTETIANFTLRGAIVPQTLTLTRNAVSVTDDGLGTVVGGFTSAPSTVDYTTGAVSLTIGMATDVITATYKLLNPGVKELSLYDDYFVKIWDFNLLHAFTTGRALMKIDGTPFDLNIDGLLDYVRGKETELIAMGDSQKKWWIFLLPFGFWIQQMVIQTNSFYGFFC